MLELNKLKVTLGSMQYCFELQAEANSITAVYGASGSGKSTLLNTIAGFLKPTSGELLWKQQSLLTLPVDQRPVTSLFQQHNLFRHLNTLQNIGLGIDPGLKLNANARAQIAEVLAEVGLEGHEEKMPDQMSGGEQQRVALARCLLRKQAILLLDEPYSALDESTRFDMLALTESVIAKHGLCAILVSHNKQDAQRLSARTLRLVDGQLESL